MQNTKTGTAKKNNSTKKTNKSKQNEELPPSIKNNINGIYNRKRYIEQIKKY